MRSQFALANYIEWIRIRFTGKEMKHFSKILFRRDQMFLVQLASHHSDSVFIILICRRFLGADVLFSAAYCRICWQYP